MRSIASRRFAKTGQRRITLQEIDMFHAAVVRCAFVTLLGMVVLLSGSAAAQSPVSVGGLDVVPIEKIKRADKETRPSPEERKAGCSSSRRHHIRRSATLM